MKKKDESEDSEESDNPNKSEQKKPYMIFSDDEDEDLDNYECGQSSGDSVGKDRLVILYSSTLFCAGLNCPS